MNASRRRLIDLLKPTNTCPECEGDGFIVVGMKAGFSVRNMEITADDDTRTCPNCEGFGVVEPVEVDHDE